MAGAEVPPVRRSNRGFVIDLCPPSHQMPAQHARTHARTHHWSAWAASLSPFQPGVASSPHHRLAGAATRVVLSRDYRPRACAKQ